MNTFKRIIDGIIGFSVAILAFIGLGVMVNRKGKRNVESKVNEVREKVQNMPIDDAIADGNDFLRKRRNKKG